MTTTLEASPTAAPLTPETLPPRIVATLTPKDSNGSPAHIGREQRERSARVDPSTWPAFDELPDDLHAALVSIGEEVNADSEIGDRDFTTTLATLVIAYMGFGPEDRAAWAAQARTIREMTRSRME